MSRSKTLGRSPHYEEPALAFALIHPSAWRNCLINSWMGLESMSSVAESGEKDDFRTVLTARRTPIRGLSRFIRQSLEEEFCEVQLAIIPRNSAAEQGGSGRKFWLSHTVP